MEQSGSEKTAAFLIEAVSWNGGGTRCRWTVLGRRCAKTWPRGSVSWKSFVGRDSSLDEPGPERTPVLSLFQRWCKARGFKFFFGILFPRRTHCSRRERKGGAGVQQATSALVMSHTWFSGTSFGVWALERLFQGTPLVFRCPGEPRGPWVKYLPFFVYSPRFLCSSAGKKRSRCVDTCAWCWPNVTWLVFVCWFLHVCRGRAGAFLVTWWFLHVRAVDILVSPHGMHNLCSALGRSRLMIAHAFVSGFLLLPEASANCLFGGRNNN